MGYEEIIGKVHAYAERIAERYHPKQIIVFGSYAKGTATENSDIDIAVVCDSLSGDYLENTSGLFRLRRDIDLRIEPVLIDLSDANNFFYNEILKTGKVVYSA